MLVYYCLTIKFDWISKDDFFTYERVALLLLSPLRAFSSFPISYTCICNIYSIAFYDFVFDLWSNKNFWLWLFINLKWHGTESSKNL